MAKMIKRPCWDKVIVKCPTCLCVFKLAATWDVVTPSSTRDSPTKPGSLPFQTLCPTCRIWVDFWVNPRSKTYGKKQGFKLWETIRDL